MSEATPTITVNDWQADPAAASQGVQDGATQAVDSMTTYMLIGVLLLDKVVQHLPGIPGGGVIETIVNLLRAAARPSKPKK